MTVRLCGQWSLTDEHACACYGMPVLVGLDNFAYGRRDVVRMFASYPYLPAAEAVRRLSVAGLFDQEDVDFINRFVGG